MHPTSNVRRRVAAGVLALAGLSGGAAHAQQPVPPMAVAPAGGEPTADVRVDAKTNALIVPLGGVVRFTPPGNRPIRDIVNRDDRIVDARIDVRSPSSLALRGVQAGATQLTLILGTKDTEAPAVFDVVVQPDYEYLRSIIRRAVPTASVDILPGPGSAIILSGFVSKPEDSDLVTRIASDAVGGNVANLINAIQIGGSQHVLVDVLVAQVNRSEARNRGFDWGVAGRNFGISNTTSALSTSSVVASLYPFTNAVGSTSFGNGPPIVPGGAANVVFGIVPGNFLGALQALRSENLAKFLTEPKVVTQTGRPAFIRVGGQQAILSAASGINGPGATLQPFGTEVEVLPIVLGNGRIYLEINPRISSVNNALGLSTAFGFTPGFSEQTTRASVTLESGQTFAIGGLIETTVGATTRKIPLLGDLPFVGTAFSSIQHTENENEVVIMVTPRLVEPMDCGQVPKRVPGKETRSPDDYELFLENLMEAPRGQRQVWSGKRYNAAYKCDPTYGKYPCIGPLCPGGVGVGCAPAGGPVLAVPAGVPVIAPVGGTAPVTPAAEPAALPAPDVQPQP